MDEKILDLLLRLRIVAHGTKTKPWCKACDRASRRKPALDQAHADIRERTERMLRLMHEIEHCRADERSALEALYQQLSREVTR